MLRQRPLPGIPRRLSDTQVEQVIIDTLETKPRDVMHRSTWMAALIDSPGDEQSADIVECAVEFDETADVVVPLQDVAEPNETVAVQDEAVADPRILDAEPEDDQLKDLAAAEVKAKARSARRRNTSRSW